MGIFPRSQSISALGVRYGDRVEGGIVSSINLLPICDVGVIPTCYAAGWGNSNLLRSNDGFIFVYRPTDFRSISIILSVP